MVMRLVCLMLGHDWAHLYLTGERIPGTWCLRCGAEL